MKVPTPTQDKTIPIGSTVRVLRWRCQYSNYLAMADYMGLTTWSTGQMVQEGECYTVVAKARHEDDHWGELLGIMSSDGIYHIIGISGVELLTEYKKPLSSQVANIEFQLQVALAEVETLKALVENIKNLVK